MSTADQYDVFISYRRSDSRDQAFEIANQMEQRPRLMGRIFIDRAIEPGQDFEERILHALNQCSVMVVIIGPEWTGDQKRPNRIKDADDWVRREVEYGLNHLGNGIEIFPILISGAKMPEAKELPNSFSKITRIHAVNELGVPGVVSKIEELLLESDQKKALQTQEIIKALPQKGNKWLPIGGIALLFTVVAVIIIAMISSGGAGDKSSDSDRTTPSTDGQGELPTPAELPLSVRLSEFTPRSERLVVTPHQSQQVLWGYGYTQGQPALYAINVADGSQIKPLATGTDLYFPLHPLNEGTAFIPSVLHYDDRWLWVGSQSEQRVIAFDPEDMTEITTWNLQGQPIDMAHFGQNLWVLTDEPAGLESVKIDSSNSRLQSNCSVSGERFETPIALETEGQGAVWIIQGRGTEGTLRRFSVENCQEVNSVPLGRQPDNLAISDGAVWVIAAGVLLRVDLQNPTEAQEITLSQNGFRLVTAIGHGKLLLTRDNNVLVYDIATGKIEQNLPVNDVPRAVVQYGAQTWIAAENGELLQYIIPNYTLANLVDILRVDTTIWGIDQDGRLCRFDTSTPTCFPLGLDGSPRTLAHHDAQSIWVSTSNKTIWQVNLANGKASSSFTLDQTAETMVEDTANHRLWVANSFAALLGFISLDDGKFEAIIQQFNEQPPSRLSYGGASLWFGFAGPTGSRVISVTYDSETQQLTQNSQISLLARLEDMQVDFNRVYVATSGLVYVYSRDTFEVTSVIGAGRNIKSLTGDESGLWASNPTSGMVYELTIIE